MNIKNLICLLVTCLSLNAGTLVLGDASGVFGGGGGGGSTLLTGLSLYAKFDESSGNAADSSANAFTLVNNGTVTYAAGQVNNAAIFSGAAMWFSLADSAAISTGDVDFEIAVWVYPTEITTTHPVISKGVDDGAEEFLLYFNPGTLTWRFKMGNDDLGSISSSAAVTANHWDCIFISYVAATDTMRIRVNSTVDTATYAGGNILTTGSLKVGTAFGSYLQGKMDVLMYWHNRVLTPAEETEFIAITQP